MALLGIGNCASALLQLIAAARSSDTAVEIAAPFPMIGPYGIGDIQPLLAIDIDRRKVGKSLAVAAFAPPNVPSSFIQLPRDFYDICVLMGQDLDNVQAKSSEFSVQPAVGPSVNLAELLWERVDVLVNLLPTGRQRTTFAAAEACLRAKVALVNAIPVPLAVDPAWARRFNEENIPLVGDDLKSQFGSTALHVGLLELLLARGVRVVRTIQTNWGGNADFFNLQDKEIFSAKRETKGRHLRALLGDSERVIINECQFVPERGDLKRARIEIEGKVAYGRNLSLRVELEVEDSPNAATILVDAIRFVMRAGQKGKGGVLPEVSAYAMKSPPLVMNAQAIEPFLLELSGNDVPRSHSKGES